MDENEAPFDPRQALQLIDSQGATARMELAYPEHQALLCWGLIYLIGYLPLALSFGPGRVLDLPIWLSLGFFYACLVVGIGTSIAITARHTRGLRGSSSRQGTFYGISWCLGFLGVAALSTRLGRLDITPEERGLIINGAAMIVVALLMMAGGAIWNDKTQFVIGAFIAGVTAVAQVLGYPSYYWIMSLVIGGGLIAAAGYTWSRRRRVPATGSAPGAMIDRGARP